MRISLLQQREPVGPIVAQTLATFWSRRGGRSVDVRWIDGRPHGRDAAAAQRWMVNVYLNAIFTAAADPQILDPIRREFSRSPVWWKRPLQAAYVRVASSPAAARHLAQASLSVSPPVPGAESLLVVAGNHKLRVLDRAGGVAYGVRKAGFRPDFMRAELDARPAARTAGVPVPELREVAPDGSWFAETYMSGTPVNRLPDARRAAAAVTAVAGALQVFLRQTCAPVATATYLAGLQDAVAALAAANRLLPSTQRRRMLTQAQRLGAIAAEPQTAITTALTHGDFQPANILVNAAGPWLIDWEYAGRRQIAYDLLVFGLAARFPDGLAARLQQFVAAGRLAAPDPLPATWPGPALDTRERRRQTAAVFLLEELHQQLRENAEPCFTAVGPGLRLLTDAIDQWLALADTSHAS